MRSLEEFVSKITPALEMAFSSIERSRARAHASVNFRNSRRGRGQKYREGSHTQLTKVTLSGPSRLTSLASARQRVGRITCSFQPRHGGSRLSCLCNHIMRRGRGRLFLPVLAPEGIPEVPNAERQEREGD